jgi:hypothetical protein
MERLERPAIVKAGQVLPPRAELNFRLQETVLHGLGLQPRLRCNHSSPKRTSCARSPAQTETTSREARYCLVSTAKS